MRFNRLLNMIGEEKLAKLNSMKIIVFGLGGVGSYAAEILARSGIGTLHVVDYDYVDITNINRQLIALESTLNQKKVSVFSDRAKDINPNINLVTHDIKADNETIRELLDEGFDYVADCIDDIFAKVAIAKYCLDNEINFISSMGFANKYKPELIKISTLNQTSVCPLAKALRKQLKLAGYTLNFPVVYSEEVPAIVQDKKILGSNAYCPSVAGIYLAAHIINDIIGEEK